MSEQYKVWCPEYGETEDDCQLLNAYSEEDAARDFAKQSYDDEPFEGSITIYVRCTFSGSETLTFIVTPEPEIYFYTREVKIN